MRAEWKHQSVAQLAHHSLGKMLDRAKNRGEPRPYLRNLNVRWFEFDLSDVLEMRFEENELERYTVRKGDLVVCEGGYPGRAAIWDKQDSIYFQKALHRVRFHEPAHARWCLYYLLFQDVSGQLKASFNGAGIQHFTGEALAKFSLPVPPTEEIHRIVAILDEAFEGIAIAKSHAEKNLRNAREVFEVQRTVTFAEYQRSWPTRALGEVTNVQSGGTPLVSKKEFWGGDIAWYSSGELNDLITNEPQRFISDAGLASSNAKLFPAGSLLIGMYDTAALKMSLLHRPAAFNQAIAGVMPNATLDTEFLLHAINVQKPQLLDLRRGVRQKNLSLGKIKEIVVPLPSICVQLELLERLRLARERSAQLESVYRRKSAALDELKLSLLHQAFGGAL